MKKRQNTILFVCYTAIFIVMSVCIGAYCWIFNSSSDINDGISLATLVSSIGTMLISGTNVLVFIKLTSSIAEREELYKKQEQQKVVANRFQQNISNIFIPDEIGKPICEIRQDVLLQAMDWFEKIRKHKTILPTLGSDEYDTFVNEFRKFCNNYQLAEDDKTIFQGKEPNITYELYRKARKISFRIIDDIVDIQ